jgi:immune inhibitor A
MQADGLHQLENNGAGRGDPGDPYPGSSGNRSFTATTNPDSQAYNGGDTRVSVTNIQLLPNGDMTMDITVL